MYYFDGNLPEIYIFYSWNHSVLWVCLVWLGEICKGTVDYHHKQLHLEKYLVPATNTSLTMMAKILMHDNIEGYSSMYKSIKEEVDM